jgi:hypothetical protein
MATFSMELNRALWHMYPQGPFYVVSFCSELFDGDVDLKEFYFA